MAKDRTRKPAEPDGKSGARGEVVGLPKPKRVSPKRVKKLERRLAAASQAEAQEARKLDRAHRRRQRLELAIDAARLAAATRKLWDDAAKKAGKDKSGTRPSKPAKAASDPKTPARRAGKATTQRAAARASAKQAPAPAARPATTTTAKPPAARTPAKQAAPRGARPEAARTTRPAAAHAARPAAPRARATRATGPATSAGQLAQREPAPKANGPAAGATPDSAIEGAAPEAGA